MASPPRAMQINSDPQKTPGRRQLWKLREAVVTLTLLGHPGRNSSSSSLRPAPTPSSSTSSCLVPSNTPPAPAHTRSINYSHSLPAASTPALLKTWTPVKPGCRVAPRHPCIFKASQVTPVCSHVWEPGPSSVPATTPTPPQSSAALRHPASATEPAGANGAV